jgi:hypothetical protein
MKLVLTDRCSRKRSDISEFSHLNPMLLFHHDEACGKGAIWEDASSPRYETAQDIIKKLGSRFGRDSGQQVNMIVMQAMLARMAPRSNADVV